MAIDTAGPHNSASFWLDVVDRLIKFLALLVGAAWTWMHYTRSRTYAEKLELDLEGKVFFKDGLNLETEMRLKNLGAARHTLPDDGTMCNVWAVTPDLVEHPLFIVPVFEGEDCIEPGEAIDDSKVFAIVIELKNIVWLKVNLHVESNEREWNLTRYIRVEKLEISTEVSDEHNLRWTTDQQGKIGDVAPLAKGIERSGTKEEAGARSVEKCG